MPDFSEILRREAVFDGSLAMGQIPVSHNVFFVLLIHFGLRQAAVLLGPDTLVSRASLFDVEYLVDSTG